MTVIQKAIPTVSAILGSQSVDVKSEYRRLAFCLVTEIDGCFVAYNSLTGEILELDAAEATALQSETVSVCDMTASLIAKWYLVPLGHDDIQLSDELIGFSKLFEKSVGIKTFTIFTTMDCNARCFYCYELGRPRTSMSVDTAKDVVSFIEKYAAKEKEIRVCWFGGEPLSNSQVIDVITEGLQAKGIQFSSHITTNGLLMDEETAQKAVEKWNLKTAQITLDGTEAVYNKVKAYVNCEGKNSFVMVTDNIESLLKRDVKVSIRMNLGDHNAEDLHDLADWLAERYKGYNKFSAYPHLLFDTDTKKFTDKNKDLLRAENLLAFEDYCIKKDILKIKCLPKEIRRSCCMADSASSITITPSGNIGKCEHFSENEFVGTIYSGITDQQKAEEFSERGNSSELCAGCPVYPVCIKLKKCPDEGDELCNEAKRLIKETQLLRKLHATYCKLKQNKKEG